jgi:hypothetical protein
MGGAGGEGDSKNMPEVVRLVGALGEAMGIAARTIISRVKAREATVAERVALTVTRVTGAMGKAAMAEIAEEATDPASASIGGDLALLWALAWPRKVFTTETMWLQRVARPGSAPASLRTCRYCKSWRPRGAKTDGI